MRSNTNPTQSNSNLRQKIVAGVLVIIILGIIWQVISLFSSDSAPAPSPAASSNQQSTLGRGPNGPSPNPQLNVPRSSNLLTAEANQNPGIQEEINKLQRELQAKYIQTLAQLQMLKLQREIAETNQAIATAKLATATADTSMQNIGAPKPVAPGFYAQSLDSTVNMPIAGPQLPVAANQKKATANNKEQLDLTIISVAFLQQQWNAVIGYQGNLYNVHTGDTLPFSNAKVTDINRSGVEIEIDGAKKKFSLVPII
jgi:hypothetical protein